MSIRMSIKLLLALALLLIASSSLPVTAQSPQAQTAVPSAENYTYLVFSSFRDGNYEIYGSTTPWDTNGIAYAIRMTNHLAEDKRPRLRPGSTQIVFESNRTGDFELFLMDWGGGNLKQLTNHTGYDGQPAWSPDGSKIAFVSEIDGNLEVAIMNADGSGLTRLTYGALDNFHPSWSPDSSRIVWAGAVDANNSAIYTMNVDGSNRLALTAGLLYADDPAWSKDGNYITFGCDLNEDGGWLDIVKIKADGSELEAIVYGSSISDYLAGPWSGVAGKELLFTEYRYDQKYLSTCAGYVNLAISSTTCFPNSYMDFYPDAALVDMSAPETYVQPLPEFSRAGNLGITVVGNDLGLAGIYALYLQARLGVDGIWEDTAVAYFTSQQTFTLPAEPGTTLYYRSRGQDLATNWESYPPGDGDTFTNVYAWQLFGRVTDNRGAAVPFASISTSPAFLDQEDANKFGAFHRYVPISPVTAAVAGMGFGSLPDTTLDSLADLEYQWALPPQDDLVVNGKFISQLDGWTNDIADPAILDSTFSHSGAASAILGASLSQQVEITSTLNLPTLSFFTSAEQVGEGDIFEVLLNDTVVFSDTIMQAAWEHTWVDVSAWAGQTVTITFAVRDNPELGSLQVHLDDVSLGSWLTPLVTAVDPALIEANTAMTLTIHGENFLPTPAVRIGETIYTSVVWVDDHTLQVNIPAGLAPGKYEVWVINPSGHSGVWQEYLQSGAILYLPFLGKN